jgi:predicted CXXCH cytochrome family protein
MAAMTAMGTATVVARFARAARGALLAATAIGLMASAAFALDPPHDFSNAVLCTSCHQGHKAPGGAITKVAGNGNLCMSCHNPAGPAAAKPFAQAHQALPGTTGTSHRWDSGPSGHVTANPANLGAGTVQSDGLFTGRIERAYVITITGNGDVGSATFSWNDGAGASGGATTASSVAINAGLTLEFTNAATSPSFRTGDTYTLDVLTDLRMPLDASMLARMTIIGENKAICSACHDQHSQAHQPFDPSAPAYGGSGTGSGRHFQRIPNSTAQMCRDCHAARDVTSAVQGSHPIQVTIPGGDFQAPATLPLDPSARLQCPTCHAPHFASSGNANAGLGDGYILRRSMSDLCLQCHTLANTASGSHFNPTTGALWPGGQYGSSFPAHTTEKRGWCINCHWPHGWPDNTTPAQDFPRLWVERYDQSAARTDPDDAEDLCHTCHDGAPATSNVRADLLKGTNGTEIFHHPVADSQQAAGRSVECVDCHNPHRATAGDRHAGVTGVNLAGGSVGPGTAIAQYELCFKCHGDTFNSGRARTSNKRLDFNTAAGNSGYHPVTQAGRGQSANLAAQLLGGLTTAATIRCTDCHNSDATGAANGAVVDSAALTVGPHGSTNAVILRAPFALNYTSSGWNAANGTLCFRCHNQGNLLARRRGDNPPSRTNFYNSSRDSLHWFHLTDKSTAASCLSCHFDLHSNRSASNTQYQVVNNAGVLQAWSSSPPSGVKSHLVNFAPDVQGTNGNPPRWQINSQSGVRSCWVSCHGAAMSPENYGPTAGDEASHTY